jgi:hypothetical protein
VIRCVATVNKLPRCSARSRGERRPSGAAGAHWGGRWCSATGLGGHFGVVVEQRLATLGLAPTSSRRKGSGRPGTVTSERFERQWGLVDRWRFEAAFKQQMQRPHVVMGKCAQIRGRC